MYKTIIFHPFFNSKFKTQKDYCIEYLEKEAVIINLPLYLNIFSSKYKINKQGLKKDLDKLIELSREDNDILIYNELNKFKDNIDEYLENVDYVYFDCSPEDAKLFLDKHKDLINKKIIIKLDDNLDFSYLEYLYNLFDDNIFNMYFMHKYNFEPINYQQYKDSLVKINEITNHIKSLNLSPLETVIYTYDLFRERIYTRETSNERKSKSRSLSEVVLGDKIVCVGYSVLISEILNKLDIKSEITLLNNKKDIKTEGHVRNEIYLKDSKYGIDGVYFLDATKDRKLDKNDEEYINIVSNLLRTYEYMEITDEDKYEFDDFPINIDLLKRKLDETLNKKIVNYSIINELNHMNQMINNKDIIGISDLQDIYINNNQIKKENIINTVNEIIAKYKKPIFAEELLTGLYNVRKIEYYMDPIKYPFNEDTFFDMYYRSFMFFKKSKDEMDKYINSSETERERSDIKEYCTFSDKLELPKKIEQVKTAKVLRKVLNKKIDENK